MWYQQKKVSTPKAPKSLQWKINMPKESEKDFYYIIIYYCEFNYYRNKV